MAAHWVTIAAAGDTMGGMERWPVQAEAVPAQFVAGPGNSSHAAGGGQIGLAGVGGPLVLLADPTVPADPASAGADPGSVMLTCPSCGRTLQERKCKLICSCGYFLSCSDYY